MHVCLPAIFASACAHVQACLEAPGCCTCDAHVVHDCNANGSPQLTARALRRFQHGRAPQCVLVALLLASSRCLDSICCMVPAACTCAQGGGGAFWHACVCCCFSGTAVLHCACLSVHVLLTSARPLQAYQSPLVSCVTRHCCCKHAPCATGMHALGSKSACMRPAAALLLFACRSWPFLCMPPGSCVSGAYVCMNVLAAVTLCCTCSAASRGTTHAQAQSWARVVRCKSSQGRSSSNSSSAASGAPPSRHTAAAAAMTSMGRYTGPYRSKRAASDVASQVRAQ